MSDQETTGPKPFRQPDGWQRALVVREKWFELTDLDVRVLQDALEAYRDSRQGKRDSHTAAGSALLHFLVTGNRPRALRSLEEWRNDMTPPEFDRTRGRPRAVALRIRGRAPSTSITTGDHAANQEP